MVMNKNITNVFFIGGLLWLMIFLKKMALICQVLNKLMKDNLVALNKLLPNYSKVAEIELVEKEFEKTPKRSIKRFLYK